MNTATATATDKPRKLETEEIQKLIRDIAAAMPKESGEWFYKEATPSHWGRLVRESDGLEISVSNGAWNKPGQLSISQAWKAAAWERADGDGFVEPTRYFESLPSINAAAKKGPAKGIHTIAANASPLVAMLSTPDSA